MTILQFREWLVTQIAGNYHAYARQIGEKSPALIREIALGIRKPTRLFLKRVGFRKEEIYKREEGDE